MEKHQFSATRNASAQAAYAELLEVTRHRELSRSVENLSGSFSKKVVKGSTYWYYQFTEGVNKTRQIFVGRDDENMRRLVERARTRNTSRVDRLAKSAIALGCAAATPAHFRVIRRLNEIGFFQAGGVLLGTHAFLSYGNALGVAWGDLSRTQDIDFAHAGNRIELALPSSLNIETRNAIESLESGFLPVPGFRPGEKTATFVSSVDRQLRVDFLAPMAGGREQVFEHKGLGVNLQPMRFLEFVLEDIDQAAIISAVGAVMANVPDPARYALHKILVLVERRIREPAKALKDLRQAAALIEVLEGFRPESLEELWNEIQQKGPGWRSRASQGIAALGKLAPHLRFTGVARAMASARSKRKSDR